MILNKQCKELKKVVQAKIETKYIKDGNNLYPAGSKDLVKDCLEKDCKHYRGCKITKFENLY